MKVELFMGVLCPSRTPIVNIDSNQSKRDCCRNRCNNQRHSRKCNSSGTHVLLSVVLFFLPQLLCPSFLHSQTLLNLLLPPFFLSHSLTHLFIHFFSHPHTNVLVLIPYLQVQTILPLLKRGVGIHHGGLLPILKEIIEILFQVRTVYIFEFVVFMTC